MVLRTPLSHETAARRPIWRCKISLPSSLSFRSALIWWLTRRAAAPPLHFARITLQCCHCSRTQPRKSSFLSRCALAHPLFTSSTTLAASVFLRYARSFSFSFLHVSFGHRFISCEVVVAAGPCLSPRIYYSALYTFHVR